MIRLSLPQKKGGVGKTTLIRILADWFSYNHHVLLVDFDDQCSLSSLFLPMDNVGSGRHKRPPMHPEYNAMDPDMEEWSGRSSSADIFYRDRVVNQYEIAKGQKGGLDILPANSQELVHVREKENPDIRERIERTIAEFFQQPAIEDMYDIILFDTGPSESPLMRGVIQASSHIIVPVELEQQCIDGLDAIVGMILEEQGRRSRDNPLNLIGLQVNKYQKVRSLHNGLLAQVRDSSGLAPYLSDILIPNRTAYAERDVRGLLPRTVFDLRPSDPARKIATQWCERVEELLFPTTSDKSTEVQHGIA